LDRAAGFLLGLPTMVAGLLVAKHYGHLGLVMTLLGGAIVGLAIVATGWTEDHDIAD
jgi:hypothetical protein